MYACMYVCVCMHTVCIMLCYMNIVFLATHLQLQVWMYVRIYACSNVQKECMYIRTYVCMYVCQLIRYIYIHTSEVTSGLAASCMATRLQLSGIADKPLNTESCMYVYVYVCMYVCMYVYWYKISIRMMYVCMYGQYETTQIDMGLSKYIHTYIHTYMHTYTYIHIHTYTYMHLRQTIWTQCWGATCLSVPGSAHRMRLSSSRRWAYSSR